ncbi:MAG: MFS transporter [Anaerolineae bacterium]|nr:MFS transporter [Anaerolineae bacterium]
MMRRYTALLHDNPDFARLWLAQVISLTGDWFNTIALMALVVAYSPENSGLAVSGLLLARFIPPMLISPAAGVLIDRFDRKRIVVWCNFLRAIVVLGFLLATTGREWLPLIYLLSVFQFTLSAVFEPGVQALLPALVKREDLLKANTLNNVTWSVMLAAGAVAGGASAALLGTNAALVIDSLTFVVAGVLTTGIRSYRRMPQQQSGDSPSSDAAHRVTFRDGLRYLRRRPETASALLIKFLGNLASVDTFIAIFATRIFILGEGGTLSLGILHSAFGVGAVAGPLLLNRFNNGDVRRMRWLVLVGFSWITLGYLTLSVSESLIAVCVGMFIRAMGGSSNWTYSAVMIQKTTDDAFLGRVSSLDWGLFYLATVIGALVNGALVDLFGDESIRTVALLACALGTGALGLWYVLVTALDRRRVATASAPGD